MAQGPEQASHDDEPAGPQGARGAQAGDNAEVEPQPTKAATARHAADTRRTEVPVTTEPDADERDAPVRAEEPPGRDDVAG